MGKSLFFALSLLAAFAQADEAGDLFAPPKYSLLDENSVNLINASPVFDIFTTGIGGERGISHSISINTTSLLPVPYSVRGYWDKFIGQAKMEVLYNEDRAGLRRDVMRVFDWDGAVDFEVWQGNSPTRGEKALASGYHYYPLDMTANRLVVSGSNNELLEWVRPNGDRSIYYRGPDSDALSSGQLMEKIYANGYSIKVHFDPSQMHKNIKDIHSVTTNTGYQLKYEYDAQSKEMDVDKQSVTHTPKILVSTNWAARNPSKIVAINNSVEYCDPLAHPRRVSGATQCNYSNAWPAAYLDWPGGMPRAFSIGDSQFSVVDANNAETVFHVKAIESTKWPNTYTPRIIAVKSASSDTIDLRYFYKPYLGSVFTRSNNGVIASSLYTAIDNVLYRSEGVSGSYDYAVFQPSNVAFSEQAAVSSRNLSGKVGGDDYTKAGVEAFSAIDHYGPGDGDSIANYPFTPGKRYVLYSGDTHLYFEQNSRNNPMLEFSKNARAVTPYKCYVYTDKGNLSEVRIQPATDQGVIIGQSISNTSACNVGSRTRVFSAKYPNENNCNSKPKTCSKPSEKTDARGNTTYYSYHEPSGQVASVRQPRSESGVVPETQFFYEQKYAKVKNSNGVEVNSFRPIWLKVRQVSCANSNLSDGSCVDGDDIVTTYEYGKNLQLVGEKVSALNHSGARIEKTTCYQYDKYGNRIGVVAPNSKATSCGGI